MSYVRPISLYSGILEMLRTGDAIPSALLGMNFIIPEEYGTITEGVDCSAVINAAIQANKTFTNVARTNANYASFCKGNVLLLQPGKRYSISSPILIEADYAESPHSYLDNFHIWGYGSQIEALPDFAGVWRYYDTTHDELINAMIAFGPKDYGKIGGTSQLYNGVFGVQFLGTGDRTLAGIYSEYTRGLQVNDLAFERLGYGFKGRISNYLQAKNLRSFDVISIAYLRNNTYQIKYDDGNSKWGDNVTNGNIRLSQIYYQGNQLNANLDELDISSQRAAIYCYAASEIKASDITIYGGFRGLELDGYIYGPSYRWDVFENMEIAQTEQEGIYLKNRHFMCMNNVQLVICVQDRRHWADYRVPHMYLEDVFHSKFTDFTIDRTGSSIANLGGHSVKIMDSDYHQFRGWQCPGQPGNIAEWNNQYSHFYLGTVTGSDGSDHNQFNGLMLGKDFSGTNYWKHAIEVDANSNFNDFDDIKVGLESITAGNEIIGFHANIAEHCNPVTNLSFNRAPAPYNYRTISGAIPCVDSGDIFHVSNAAPVNMTNVSRDHEGKKITLIFDDGNCTVVHDITKFYLAGLISWNPQLNDMLHLYCSGGVWYETGRSDNS